jgi:hypothetical protein
MVVGIRGHGGRGVSTTMDDGNTGYDRVYENRVPVPPDHVGVFKSLFQLIPHMTMWINWNRDLKRAGWVLTQLPETTLQLPSCIQKI